MTDAHSLKRKAIKYLPVVPFLFLVGYHAARVDRYPSRIGVTKRSCSDPKNAGRITFRGETFCVRPDEAETWDRMWRNEYLLMGVFVAWYVSAALCRRDAPTQ